MNRESVIATLTSIIKPDAWEESQDYQNRRIRYIRLFPMSENEGVVCLSEHGYWAVVSRDQIWEFIEEERAYIFYMLLYSPLPKIATQLKHSLCERGLPIQIALTFPFDALLLAAIATDKHWKDLAIKWVENGYPINDEIRLALCQGDKQSPYWLRWQEERLRPMLRLNDTHDSALV